MVEGQLRQMVHREPFDVVAVDEAGVFVDGAHQRPIHDGHHRQTAMRTRGIAEGIQLFQIPWVQRRRGFQCGIGRLLQRMVGPQVSAGQRPLPEERLPHAPHQGHPQRRTGIVAGRVRGRRAVPGCRPQGQNHHGHADLRGLSAPLRNVAHNHHALVPPVRMVTRYECTTYSQHDYKWVSGHAEKRNRLPPESRFMDSSDAVHATMPLAISSRETSRYSLAVLWFGA